MSIIKIDAKILNTISARRIKQYIKNVIHHEQVRFIQICMVVLTLKISHFDLPYLQTKNKNHMIITICREKSFKKSNIYLFMTKTQQNRN